MSFFVAAPRTSYDASFPARWVEAMKKPSRAGSKPAKARPHSAFKPRGRNAAKPQSNRRSAADNSDFEVARLKRELREALEQQTATSEVLQVINSSLGELQPVFEAMLEKAVRICDAKFGNIHRWDGNALHLIATHNTPSAFAEYRGAHRASKTEKRCRSHDSDQNCGSCRRSCSRRSLH